MKKITFYFLLFTFYFAFAIEPNKEDILFQEGLYHYQQGRYDLAIKLFSDCLEICPTYPKIEEMLVSAIKKRAESLKTGVKSQESGVGSRESGVRSQEEEIKEEKHKPETKPLEYEAFKDELKFEEKETKTLTSDEEEYLFGRKLISLGMVEEGVAYLENILKEKPKIGFADKILFTIGEAKKDENTISKLLKEYPKTALKYEARLLICNLNKDYKKAIIEYMKLIKDLSNGTLTDLFPNIPPNIRNLNEIRLGCQIGLGNSYKELGDYTQSIVEYKKILDESSLTKELDKEPKINMAEDACFYIADIYDRYPKARDFVKAVEYYGRLIKEYPNSIWVERAKMRKKHIEENYL